MRHHFCSARSSLLGDVSRSLPCGTALLVPAVQWDCLRRQSMPLATCAVPSVCCYTVPGDPVAVPLYLPPSFLSWGQWGGAESVWWRRGRQSRVSSLQHKVSVAVAPRWDSLAFLCQDGESQPWRLQSDVAPRLPKLVWWAQDRQHSKCFISIMSCIVRQ